jgi:hypothetical protein
MHNDKHIQAYELRAKIQDLADLALWVDLVRGLLKITCSGCPEWTDIWKNGALALPVDDAQERLRSRHQERVRFVSMVEPIVVRVPTFNSIPLPTNIWHLDVAYKQEAPLVHGLPRRNLDEAAR